MHTLVGRLLWSVLHDVDELFQSRSEHTKHMIRFRHADSLPSVAVGDSLVEVVLVNSHDGTSSYKLMAGIFRLVCSNGMVVSESMRDSIHCVTSFLQFADELVTCVDAPVHILPTLRIENPCFASTVYPLPRF